MCQKDSPLPLLPDPRAGEEWGPKVRGNGAALFEMFSYLILCPKKRGPASFSGLALCTPVPCSNTCLVQLMTWVLPATLHSH